MPNRENAPLPRATIALLLTALQLPHWNANAGDSIVPIEEEPRHRLKFENPHVRFFDVQLPPGYESKWHTHLHDGVFIVISTSETLAQDYGADAVKRPPRPVGNVLFADYTRRPKAHRVTNIGNGEYRVVDTEIHRGCGGYKAAMGPTSDRVLVDNDRVLVTRVLLAPGESLLLQPPCGMLVAVDTGSATLNAGGGEARLELQPASFQWRQSGTPVTLTNTGTTPLHAIDVLVK